MTEKVIHGKMIAKKDGKYSVYVISDLNSNELYMCTRLPNWQVQEINIGDTGFFKIQYIFAGDKYYNLLMHDQGIYNYSNIYFINFIKDGKITKDITL